MEDLIGILALGNSRSLCRRQLIPLRRWPLSGVMICPALRGWWKARDLDLKEEFGLFLESGQASRQRRMRERGWMQLLKAFRNEGLLRADKLTAVDEPAG
jgi:hypothetical protein